MLRIAHVWCSEILYSHVCVSIECSDVVIRLIKWNFSFQGHLINRFWAATCSKYFLIALALFYCLLLRVANSWCLMQIGQFILQQAPIRTRMRLSLKVVLRNKFSIFLISPWKFKISVSSKYIEIKIFFEHYLFVWISRI